MRIRLEHSGTVFEFERAPLPEHRFKALCLLAAGGLYVGMAIAVAKLCGVFGLIVLGVATFLVIVAANDFL